MLLMCVCMWSSACVVCLTSCVWGGSNHLTLRLPCYILKESVFSSLSVIVQLISTQCPPHPSERPISLLSASLQSKWDAVFDVQASFEPLWEMKLKFVNRGPCSQDPTGSLLLPSLPPSRGRETSEKRYLLTSNEQWRGGSFVKEHCGSTLFRIVLIPPLSRASQSLSLKALLLFQVKEVRFRCNSVTV